MSSRGLELAVMIPAITVIRGALNEEPQAFGVGITELLVMLGQ